ncbi:MAG: CvpA family protein [Bacteroidales bacterium]
MNFIDLIVIVLLLWSAYRGFTKGFILQLSTLAALILGILGAIKFSDFTATLLSDHFEISSDFLNIAAFAITLVVIVIAVHLVARVVEKLIQAIALGFINRILGVLLGIAKTAFILSVILVLINKANDKYHFIPEERINNSYLYQPLSGFAPMIFPYLKFGELQEDYDYEEDKREEEGASMV